MIMNDASLPERSDENRTARMSVLAWHQEDGKVYNMFTHIRHRRNDTMGPWAEKPNQIWHTTEFSTNEIAGAGEIRLYRTDTPLAHCLDLVKDILDKGVLDIDDIEICYTLERLPRTHWAYRNHIMPDDISVVSPFTKHSAKVTEFWGFVTEAQEYWQTILESGTSQQITSLLRSLGFRLDKRLDRIGNLMISGAEDHITSTLNKRTNHLRLSVRDTGRNDLPANIYSATIWAKDSRDTIVQHYIEVTKEDTVINIESEADQIGFAIYRQLDGQCIDIWEAALIREITFTTNITTGQTLRIHDSRRRIDNIVDIGSAYSVINVGGDSSDDMDRKIRQAVLGRISWQRDRDARQEGNLGRYEPDQIEQAIDFFLNLLNHRLHPDKPIYLADPFFMHRDLDNISERIYSSMFGLTRGRQLRILCGQLDVDSWLSRYPSLLTNHITVKSFTRKNKRGEDKPSFHDRYLITPDKETIITHSINGWHSQGVTFATLPYGVYRAEAEELWAMNIGRNSNGIYVREVK